MEKYKVECWVERVQPQTIWVETFDELEEARETIERDFMERCEEDTEFLNYGGYHLYELECKWVGVPFTIIKTPTVIFK